MRSRRLYSLLDLLSTRERLVLVLRHVEGMTLEEIAEAMEMSLATVKRTLRHASTRLSELVDADVQLRPPVRPEAEAVEATRRRPRRPTSSRRARRAWPALARRSLGQMSPARAARAAARRSACPRSAPRRRVALVLTLAGVGAAAFAAVVARAAAACTGPTNAPPLAYRVEGGALGRTGAIEAGPTPSRRCASPTAR